MIAALQDWTASVGSPPRSWSSHRDLVRDAPPRWLDVDRLLDHLAAWGGDPRRRYLELVAEAAGTA